MTTISDLKFDDKNFNEHTEFGMSLLEKSLHDYGAGRSILIDKDNNIIAGNGIVEAAAQAGIEKVRIVETKGDEIVAVKRTDVELNTEFGRGMAFAGIYEIGDLWAIALTTCAIETIIAIFDTPFAYIAKKLKTKGE